MPVGVVMRVCDHDSCDHAVLMILFSTIDVSRRVFACRRDDMCVCDYDRGDHAVFIMLVFRGIDSIMRGF